jgi:phosphoribosyl-AMP cyclohydrolase
MTSFLPPFSDPSAQDEAARLRPKFDETGLIAAIAQHAVTGEVLMLAWMNAEALAMTIETRTATFWSRSRQRLWVKGESSGHTLHVDEIRVDCDQDAVLLRVRPAGPACHTGRAACFYRRVGADGRSLSISLEKE